MSSGVFVVRGSEEGQCAESLLSRPKRANKAKRHCSYKLPASLAFVAGAAENWWSGDVCGEWWLGAVDEGGGVG